MELVINFSGGKDSCAMLHYLCTTYPHLPKKVVFADTGWEHTDAINWAKERLQRYRLSLHIVRNASKTFLSMVKTRKKFPSASARQCTSDLKRAPIEKWIRQEYVGKVVINCLGMRASESPSRAKKPALRRNKQLTNSRRTVWDWLPIKNWSDEQVYAYLEDNGIPLHPSYQYLQRYSCRICIFMSVHDLRQVKIHDPHAFDTIAKLERQINFSMKSGIFLDQLGK
jgi:3'-phosphoadenosine 5'-phosphosulfate sulfotransferase (PAPS reductase)/FAD synthetase